MNRRFHLMDLGYDLVETGYSMNMQGFYNKKSEFEHKYKGKDIKFYRAKSDTKGLIAWELWIR